MRQLGGISVGAKVVRHRRGNLPFEILKEKGRIARMRAKNLYW